MSHLAVTGTLQLSASNWSCAPVAGAPLRQVIAGVDKFPLPTLAELLKSPPGPIPYLRILANVIAELL